MGCTRLLTGRLNYRLLSPQVLSLTASSDRDRQVKRFVKYLGNFNESLSFERLTQFA
jgi:hypothetical protein